MNRRHLLGLVIAAGWLAQSRAAAQELATVAESSDWRATSTHAECLQLCRDLAAASPRVHLASAGETTEGRDLMLLVIADPPVRDPSEVGERLVAFAWGGIHSGEVCGKPATLMLARELATAEEPGLLEHLVIVLLPLLNADGNDRMSPDNRRGQQGPVEGMGTRRNAQDLNINRDFTKLETPEGRAVAGVLTRWNPAIAMDLHTTNGSRHQYVLTYDSQRHPACDGELLAYARDELLPTVRAALEEASGYKSFLYGNFNRDKTRWSMYPALPRYSTHYLGLRHHIGVLSEAYSYAPYRDRVLGTREFVRHCFQVVADQRERVREVIGDARRRTHERVVLKAEPRFSEEPSIVLGWAGERGEEEPVEVEVRTNGVSVATHAVDLPMAYLLPPGDVVAGVRDNLRAHGIELEQSTGETQLAVEVYRVQSLERAQRAYEGHQTVSVRVESRVERRALPAGTLVVRTSQPLGMLAAYLLEPESDDGLCTWNFFDSELEEGADYPVLRLAEAQPLATEPLER